MPHIPNSISSGKCPQVSFLPGSPWGARTHELPGVCWKQAAERCSEDLRVQHGQVLGPSRVDREESASLANPPEPLMLLLLGPSGRCTGLVVLQEHWVGTEAGRQSSEVTKVKQEPPQLSCLFSGRLPPGPHPDCHLPCLDFTPVNPGIIYRWGRHP